MKQMLIILLRNDTDYHGHVIVVAELAWYVVQYNQSAWIDMKTLGQCLKLVAMATADCGILAATVNIDCVGGNSWTGASIVLGRVGLDCHGNPLNYHRWDQLKTRVDHESIWKGITRCKAKQTIETMLTGLLC